MSLIFIGYSGDGACQPCHLNPETGEVFDGFANLVPADKMTEFLKDLVEPPEAAIAKLKELGIVREKQE